MKTWHKLALICLAALVLRGVLAALVEHPGIADPNHYYNLGRELAGGHGFQIDYIWQFYASPEAVVHPIDWWMPLTGVIAAGGIAVFGVSVHAALVPFVVLGALLPLLAYAAARQLGGSETAALFAAAAVAVLPEFVLNSVRTNTLIPNALLVCGAIMLLVRGMRTGDWRALAGSGLLAGLAYLTRSEAILLLPMLIVTTALYAVVRPSALRAKPAALLLPVIVAGLVVAPWLARNLHEFGWLTPPNQSQFAFWDDIREQYAYEPHYTWSTLRASQSLSAIVAKRLFEMAASVKLLYTGLDVFLPVPVIGGLLWLAARRDRDRLLTLAPTLILLLGFFVFYTVINPYMSQGGSFKKAYLSLVPLLIPVGAIVMERAITDRRLLLGAMGLALVLMTGNAVEMVRADVRFTNTYVDDMRRVVATARTLPDTNGDGDIVLMNQDQFMLSFLGMKSVVIPFDDRETILTAAQRYGVDYLLMPPARPSIDALFQGEEVDPRFVLVATVPGTQYELYRLEPDQP
jgi:hypothetical protein